MKPGVIFTIVNFSLLIALLVFEPLRCGGRLPEVPAAQFPPAIIIVEGKTAQGFPYLQWPLILCSSANRQLLDHGHVQRPNKDH